MTPYLRPREVQVLGLMAQGKNYDQVADTLHISWETVKTHALNVRVRLNAKSTQQAIAICVHHGLIKI